MSKKSKKNKNDKYRGKFSDGSGNFYYLVGNKVMFGAGYPSYTFDVKKFKQSVNNGVLRKLDENNIPLWMMQRNCCMDDIPDGGNDYEPMPDTDLSKSAIERLFDKAKKKS